MKDKELEDSSRTHLGTFTREGFLEKIGNTLYEGLDENDYTSMYKRAYKTFMHNQGKPFKITPEPIPPEQIKGEVTLELLGEVEGSVAIQYSFGFKLICDLSKDPIQEIRKGYHNIEKRILE